MDGFHQNKGAGERDKGGEVLCRPRGDVWANVEQDLEVAAVAGLAAGQVEGQRQAIEIELQVDFAGKAAARSAECLPVLPPFAPAAETWARTIVESTIWTR